MTRFTALGATSMSKDKSNTKTSIKTDVFIPAYMEHQQNGLTSQDLANHLGINTQSLYNQKSIINKKLTDAGYEKLPNLKSNAKGRKSELDGHAIKALIDAYRRQPQ